jgi:hypothetical protein
LLPYSFRCKRRRKSRTWRCRLGMEVGFTHLDAFSLAILMNQRITSVAIPCVMVGTAKSLAEEARRTDHC